MSGRKNYVQHKLVEAQSLASAFTSKPTVIQRLDNCSYQINVVTSDSQGTFTVQASDDYEVYDPTDTVINPGKWIDLPLSRGNLSGPIVPTVSAANDEILIDLNQVPFNAIRIIYTPTTPGTGVCDIWVTAKML